MAGSSEERRRRERRQGVVALIAMGAAVPLGILLVSTRLRPVPSIRDTQNAYLHDPSWLMTTLCAIAFCAVIITVSWLLARRMMGANEDEDGGG